MKPNTVNEVLYNIIVFKPYLLLGGFCTTKIKLLSLIEQTYIECKYSQSLPFQHYISLYYFIKKHRLINQITFTRIIIRVIIRV